MIKRHHWSASFCLDLLLGLLLLILLIGGIEYQGSLFLSHGADLRRGMLILWGASWLVAPEVARESLFCKSLHFAFHALRSSSGRKKAAFCSGFFILFCALSQTLALRVPLYDVGIYHQLLWALGEGRGFYSTISGNHTFLLDHFCPSLLLLLPLFKATQWVSPNALPFFLPVIQIVLILGGAGAWLYFAGRLKQPLLSQAVFCFILSFQSLWGNLKWGFHENALAFLCVSWAIVFILLKERKLTSLCLLLIAAFCKEILMVDVALISVIWGCFLFKKDKAWAMGLFFLSGALCLGFVGFELLPRPQDKNYFQRYYSYLGLGLKEIYTHFSPFLFLSGFQENVGMKATFQYLIRVFSPWLGLPLWMVMKKRKEAFLLVGALPSFLSAVLSTYPPLRNTSYHYALELWPILAPLTLLCLREIRNPVFPFVWIWVAVFQLELDPLAELRKDTREASILNLVRQKIREFPESASLVADELSGTWVSGRAQVTRFADFNENPTFALLREGSAKDQLPGSWHELWKLEGWAAYERDR